jgi:hypothetical protein
MNRRFLTVLWAVCVILPAAFGAVGCDDQKAVMATNNNNPLPKAQLSKGPNAAGGKPQVAR